MKTIPTTESELLTLLLRTYEGCVIDSEIIKKIIEDLDYHGFIDLKKED